MAIALSEERIEEAREQLAEADAVSLREYQSTSVPLLGDAELQRTWDEISEDIIPWLIEYLHAYTSAKNLKPQSFVSEPMVDGEVVPGTWRNAFVRRITAGEVTRLVQVLREGFITGLVKDGKLNTTEARVTESRHLPADPEGEPAEHYVTMAFTGVSPEHVHAIIASIDTLDAADFDLSAKGEEWGTGYYRLFTTHRVEDDGSATILLYLAEPRYALYAYAAFGSERKQDVTYLWNVPRMLAQDILDGWQGAGRTASASYDKGTGVVDLVLRDRTASGFLLDEPIASNCDADETADFYWGVTNPDLYGIPVLPQGATGRRNIQTNGDGTYDVTVSVSQVKARIIGNHLRSVSSIVDANEYIQLGIVDDADIPDISTPTFGHVYTQQLRVRDDCSKDVTTTDERGIYQSHDFIYSRQAMLGIAESGWTRNAGAAMEAPAASIGQIYQVRSTLNNYGSYDNDVVSDTSVEAELYAAWSTHGGIAGLWQWRNQRSVPAGLQDPSDVYGNVSVSATINEDGTYDFAKVKTPAGSGSTSVVDWDTGDNLYLKFKNNINQWIYVYQLFTSDLYLTQQWCLAAPPYSTGEHGPGFPFTIIGADSGYKTGRKWLGDDKWEATRVERE